MKIKKISAVIFPLLLLLISFLPLLDLFHPGLPITHDGKDHVARIANFYLNLQQGNFIPRWAENLNWGYGHPILMFLYPLPSYIASVFHFTGFSLVDSTKIVYGIGFVFSGLAMYLWLQAFLPKQAAFFGGLLYMFAPYRFVDLYVRGDIGENLAFIFLPLVLYFLYKYRGVIPHALIKSNDKQRYRDRLRPYLQFIKIFQSGFLHLVLGSFSLAGLILAHNAIALMFVPAIVMYAVFLLLDSRLRGNDRKKSQHSIKIVLFPFILLLLFGFALAAFFWVPALLEGKYTLRNIVTKGDYVGNFVSLTRLLYGKWSYGISGEFSVQIGIMQWLSVILSVPLFIFFLKKKNPYWQLLAGCWVFFFVAIFLMVPVSSFVWSKVTLLQNFQFPWRFLAVTVFVTAVFGALVVSILPKKIMLGAVIVSSICLLAFNSSYWHANGYLFKPEKFYTGVYAGTTDTGESSPIWSVRFMEHTPKAHLEVLDGSAKITEEKRTATQHLYLVSAAKNSFLRENTLYFPGWKILVDGVSVPIQFQDPNNRGVMIFSVPSGRHSVSVIFTETKLRLIADWVSLLTFLMLAGLSFTKIVYARGCLKS